MDNLAGHMRQIEQGLEERATRIKEASFGIQTGDLHMDEEDEGPAGMDRFMKDYHIGSSRKEARHLPTWVTQNMNDPAFEVCQHKMDGKLSLIAIRTLFPS